MEEPLYTLLYDQLSLDLLLALYAREIMQIKTTDLITLKGYGFSPVKDALSVLVECIKQDMQDDVHNPNIKSVFKKWDGDFLILSKHFLNGDKNEVDSTMSTVQSSLDHHRYHYDVYHNIHRLTMLHKVILIKLDKEEQQEMEQEEKLESASHDSKKGDFEFVPFGSVQANQTND